MHSSTGRTRASAAASPPIMIDSVPLMAPISPPLTGASSIVPPRFGHQRRKATVATRRDTAHVDDDCPLQPLEDSVRAGDDRFDVGRRRPS